jgi:malonate-semialdehyde dehydrogenase (acetylating)/methylmalonate-semialdehyde dehydrogenase
MSTTSTVSVPTSVAVARVPLWINGQHAVSQSGRHGVVTNPATGDVIRAVPFADAADVDRAVKAAVAAFPAWRATPPLRRARILNRFRRAGRAAHRR